MNIFLSVLAVLILLIISHIHRRSQAKNRALLVIEDNCTGCRRCVKRCQRKALEIVNKKVVLNSDRCTSCGSCVSMCKFNALKMVNRNRNSVNIDL